MFLCFGAQIINDNMMYAKVVVRMGVRTECKNCDFSDILEDEDVSILYSTSALQMQASFQEDVVVVVFRWAPE